MGKVDDLIHPNNGRSKTTRIGPHEGPIPHLLHHLQPRRPAIRQQGPPTASPWSLPCRILPSTCRDVQGSEGLISQPRTLRRRRRLLKAGRSLVRRNRLAEALWMVERCMIIACWRLACLCTDDALGGVAGAGTIPRKSRKFVLH